MYYFSAETTFRISCFCAEPVLLLFETNLAYKNFLIRKIKYLDLFCSNKDKINSELNFYEIDPERNVFKIDFKPVFLNIL